MSVGFADSVSAGGDPVWGTVLPAIRTCDRTWKKLLNKVCCHVHRAVDPPRMSLISPSYPAGRKQPGRPAVTPRVLGEPSTNQQGFETSGPRARTAIWARGEPDRQCLPS